MSPIASLVMEKSDTTKTRGRARRRRAGLSVSCTVDDCEDGDHRSVDNELEWLDRNGAHCNGDSGGPALDNFGRVIGIVSRSRSLGEEICTSHHTYTSVYDWAEWIQYHTRAVSAEEGVESAPWTMGYSTLPEYNFPVGETCEGGGDCLSGLCHEGVCIRSCSDEGPCPSGFQCQGDTLRQVCIPEAEGSEESSFEDNSAEDAGGCASANGTPLALLGILVGASTSTTQRLSRSAGSHKLPHALFEVTGLDPTFGERCSTYSDRYRVLVFPRAKRPRKAPTLHQPSG